MLRTIARRRSVGRLPESGSAEPRITRPRVVHHAVPRHAVPRPLAHHRAVAVAVRGSKYRPQDHQTGEAEGPEAQVLSE